MKAIQSLFFIVSFTATILSLSAASQTTDFTYVHPLAGSENLNPEQNIILKHKQGIDPASVQKNSISINGSISGAIEFDLMLAEDNKTILLTPVKPFTLGEMVSVNIPRGIKTSNGIDIKPLQFSFGIPDFDRVAIYTRLKELSVEEEVPTIPYNGNKPKDYIDDIQDNEIQVYPNPFSNQITINNPDKKNQNARIYDAAGTLIHEEAIHGETIQINTQSYPPGIYFIQVIKESNQHSTVYKTIKR